MEAIKIEVTGNIARVTQKPTKLTSGTVGLPVEFTFDEQWDGLKKVAVFRAGEVKKTVDIPDGETTVPWEVMDKPKVWLSTGVYGINEDGTVVIPTIWANVSVIRSGVDLEGDDPTDPEAPIWKTLTESVEEAIDNANKAAEELREAIENGEIDVGDIVKTVNGIEPDENGNVEIEVGGGGASALTVTYEGNQASHTATEIYEAVQAGCMVVLQHYENYLMLHHCYADCATFVYTADDAVNTVILITDQGMVEETEISYATNYAINEIEKEIGDISAALDAIIAIQEELIGV